MENEGVTSWIVQVQVQLLNQTKRFSFNFKNGQAPLSDIKNKVGQSFSLGPNSFELNYKDDDNEILKLSDDNDLLDALSFFGDGESTRVTLKLFISVLYQGPNLSEAASSESGWEQGISERSYGFIGKGKGVERNANEGGTSEQLRREEIGSHSRYLSPPPPDTQYPTWLLEATTDHSDSSSYGPPGFSAPPTTTRRISDSTDKTLERNDLSPPPSISSISSMASSSIASDSTSSILVTTQTPLSAPPTYTSGSIGNFQKQAHSISDVSESSISTTTTTTDNESYHHSLEPSTHSFTVHVTTTQQEIYNVPNFLADLTSSRIPTPSIFSSIPDILLNCSGCQKKMEEFRYICSACGPLVPQDDEEEEEKATSDDGTESLELTTTFLDPLGAIDPSTIALPLSPLASSSGLNSPLVPLSPQSALTVLPLSSPPVPVLEEEEERGGYELCINCIGSVGILHVQEMSRVQGTGGSEEVELRHAFSEVMKIPSSSSSSSLNGWREVDCDDLVNCSICYSGPLKMNRFKCLSCREFDLCLKCYQTVEEIHPVHTFLSIPDLPARPPPLSPRPTESVYTRDTTHDRATPQDMKLAFLRARGLIDSNGQRLVLNTLNSTANHHRPERTFPARHEGIICFGCLVEVVGPRFSCSICKDFDLCSKCEAIEPCITSPDGRHESNHILLKIKIPVHQELIDLANSNAKARTLALTRRNESTSQVSSSSIIWTPPPPPSQHQYPPTVNLPFPPSAPLLSPVQYLSSLLPSYWGTRPILAPLLPTTGDEERTLSEHGISRCSGCEQDLRQERWMCGQCNSKYELCDMCEKSSNVIHDPLHCFLRITGALHPALPRNSQLLPILYDIDSINRFNGSFDASDDGFILHANVICDNCTNIIVGPWCRCCHCETSFDVCYRCLDNIKHDPRHVFVKMNKNVDMKLLRDLTGISSGHPRPLIPFALYDN